MIEIASVEALYDHLSLVAEVLQDPDRFLINSMGIIVLGEGAIVHVGELAGHLPVIEEIIYIHLVYVATCIKRGLICRLLLLLLGVGRV